MFVEFVVELNAFGPNSVTIRLRAKFSSSVILFASMLCSVMYLTLLVCQNVTDLPYSSNNSQLVSSNSMFSGIQQKDNLPKEY